jgi:hypothetical protein
MLQGYLARRFTNCAIAPGYRALNFIANTFLSPGLGMKLWKFRRPDSSLFGNAVEYLTQSRQERKEKQIGFSWRPLRPGVRMVFAWSADPSMKSPSLCRLDRGVL